MIFHASVPADEPERVAGVIAEVCHRNRIELPLPVQPPKPNRHVAPLHAAFSLWPSWSIAALLSLT